MEHRFLVISECPRRGGGAGLTGSLLDVLSHLPDYPCEVDLLDSSFFLGHKAKDYCCNHYFSMPSSWIVKIGLSIPHLSSYIKERIVCGQLKKELSRRKYELVIVYQVLSFSDRIVSIAHRYGTKVLLRPWGSEVLRVSDQLKPRIQKAYNMTDYVGGDPDSNVIHNAIEVFNVERSKIINLASGLSGIRNLIRVKESNPSQETMAANLGISANSFLIVCGYNAYAGQRHTEIIDQIASVKQYLPDNYILLFPMTYGGDNRIAYIEQLSELCNSHGLTAKFIKDFLSAEQIAYIHLLTNLYINVQPTDSGNAFLIEALFCGNKIICGSWLDYPQLMKYGFPYYQCESIQTIGDTVKQVLCGSEPERKVPQELIDEWADRNRITPEERWTSFLLNI